METITKVLGSGKEMGEKALWVPGQKADGKVKRKGSEENRTGIVMGEGMGKEQGRNLRKKKKRERKKRQNKTQKLQKKGSQKKKNVFQRDVDLGNPGKTRNRFQEKGTGGGWAHKCGRALKK